jgi:DegV family protein with EDD domain
MTTQSLEIITDSTCDIPAELVQQYGITVLPHVVIWGEEQFRDRIDMQPEQFYQRLENDPVYPSTAHATELDFTNAYRAAMERGVQEILVLTVSSAMSGTYHAALQASSQVGVPVHVVDSHGPTMSLGWQVLAAARERDLGGSIQAILAKVEQVRQSLVQFVAMDSLEYLHKGGRIGNAQHLLGSLLNIKPLVYIDHITGLVESAGNARTHTKLVEMLMRQFFSKIDITRSMHIAVLHGNVLEEAQQLASRIMREFSPVELLINITGPVLGVNTGPRALALCGYTD